MQDIIKIFKDFNLKTIETNFKIFLKNPNQNGLKLFFNSLMTLDKNEIRRLVEEVVLKIPEMDYEFCDLIKILNVEHPQDIGVVCPLLLNTIKLKPEEAMFLQTGEPHAYINGCGVEVMANSDNVLRGGLTIKYIDVPELLKTLTFYDEVPDVIRAKKIDEIESLYSGIAPEFCLSRINVSSNKIYKRKKIEAVKIIIIVEGEIHLRSSLLKHELLFKQGMSFLVSADTPDYSLYGNGEAFKVTVPVE